MEELSQADLEILSELNKKIEYYTRRINECKDGKKYIVNKMGVNR